MARYAVEGRGWGSLQAEADLKLDEDGQMEGQEDRRRGDVDHLI